MNNEGSIVIAKLSSLRNDHSINLNISDHVRFLRENMTIAGKYDDCHYKVKKEAMFNLC